jgi:hypothetical protein
MCGSLSGQIVIVGVTSKDAMQGDGHVALILGGGDKGNRLIYGGSSGGAKSKGNKKLSEVFRRSYWDKLKFWEVN